MLMPAKKLKVEEATMEMESSSNLFIWAKENGARTNSRLYIQNERREEKDCDRAIHTAKAIEAGEAIIFIPNKLLMSANLACSSPLGKAIKGRIEKEESLVSMIKFPHALEMICFAAWLLLERQKKSLSFWAPYISSLPLDYNLPVCWNREAIPQLLAGTSLEYVTLQRIRWMERAVEVFNETPAISDFFEGGRVDIKDFIWAYASITSRAFPKGNSTSASGPVGSSSSSSSSSNGEEGVQENDWITISEICLYPVLDMLNHKRNFKIEWVTSPEGVSFVSRELILPGTQVFNNYGPKGNENLLGNYGFVLEDNPEDYVKLTLNTTTADPLFDDRIGLLSDRGLSQVHLIFLDDQDLPEMLLEVAKIMVANEFELKFMKKALSSDTPFRSVKNDILCLSVLYKLLDGKLSLLLSTNDKASIYPDLNLLALAVTYRKGQIDIMHHHLDLIRKKGREILQLERFSLLENPSLLCSSSHLENLTCIEILSSSGNENPPDDFIFLSFILVELSKLSTSPYYITLRDFISANDSKKCKKILGVSEYQNFKDFYAEEILPLLDHDEFESFSKNSFLWAYTLLTLRGGDFPSFLLQETEDPNLLADSYFLFL